MKKLKLDLDTLQVETFEAKDQGPAEGGTVLAHQESRYDCPPTERCSDLGTCVATCGWVDSCWYPC